MKLILIGILIGVFIVPVLAALALWWYEREVDDEYKDWWP